MPSNDDDVRRSFPLTQWSLVQRAGQEGVDGKEALSALLHRYQPVLLSHLVIRQRIDTHRANDLLQGFLTAKVLEQRLILKADQTRGRFRTFLLTALDRYVIDEIRYSQAAKRSGEQPDVDVEVLVEMPAPLGAPDRGFDVAWAKQVLADAQSRMREECTRTGRGDLWAVFEGRVLLPAMEGMKPVEYEALVREHGFRSPVEASNAMITSKRTFARHLRAVVAEYAGGEAETDAEIRDLYRIVSGGRAE
jgi:RNA polymerase sigma-70 factor (ECF subfamily)